MYAATFTVTEQQANHTLAKLLRGQFPGRSWSEVRNWVARRRVLINGDMCLDSNRRLQAGEIVEVREQSLPKPAYREELVIRHVDAHIVVIEKPAGIPTVRHPAERQWSERRRAMSPTLDDLTSRKLVKNDRKKTKLPRLRVVHRLDKHTSGLVVFARTVAAERHLGRQFHDHSVLRRYWACVHGQVRGQTIRSRLVRDRGDGRRGSTPSATAGKEAVTHVDVIQRLPNYTIISCRLETGRTHQIRIHLAELGHPVCGETVYQRKPDGTDWTDDSGAPRLALHAMELGFVHPSTNESMKWTMDLPRDLQKWVDRLAKASRT